jgi:hypothetical protein
MFLIRRNTRGVPCRSCGVDGSGHALDCAAWWIDHRRTRFDGERAGRYQRIAWLAVTGVVCAWALDADGAAAAFLTLSILLFAALVLERRKPIA